MKRKDPGKAREIGTRIAEARNAAGMGQRELAELLGVSERSIQAYEQGETIPWRFGEGLAEALNRPTAWFWYGPEAAGSTSSENLLQIGLTELRSFRAYLEVELLSVHEQLAVLRSEVEALTVAPTSKQEMF